MSAQEEHRCIAWRREDSPPPAALIGALERRGIRPDVQTDRFGALASVLIAHRDASHASEGPAPSPTILLLIEPSRLAGAADVVRAAAAYAPNAVCWAFEADATPALRAIGIEDLQGDERSASPAPDADTLEAADAKPPAAFADDPDFQPGVVEVLSGRTFARRGSDQRVGTDPSHPPAGAPAGRSRPVPPLRLAGEGPIEPLGVNSDASDAELKEDTPGQDPASGLLTAEELEMLLADDEDARGHG